ncbi:Tumor necrosis factor receptor superfamily member 6 [Merluccius polli]|uniref:Tumor necrosis factor receptor superfamily member 6 n=1 Tax=Merluccius polli TaxID=89951 RepID=A0AA47N751_MERPO|nr:Tumor necrosis factor receptor superfamily member 6 [Merluccius polli]
MAPMKSAGDEFPPDGVQTLVVVVTIANLEVKEECTITKDAVCQCREDHYCSSTLCTTCNPCDKCEGRAVKSLCTGTTNTVCGEKDVDIKPHVEEIATALRWWFMRDVALKSGFTRDDINSLRLKHPDFTERTPQLLHQWVEKMEKMGNNATRELLEKLTDLRRFYVHDRVLSILYMRKPAET